MALVFARNETPSPQRVRQRAYAASHQILSWRRGLTYGVQLRGFATTGEIPPSLESHSRAPRERSRFPHRRLALTAAVLAVRHQAGKGRDGYNSARPEQIRLSKGTKR